jgi:hypothetical protein
VTGLRYCLADNVRIDVDLGDFIADNAETFDAETIAALRALQPGQSYRGGGGAAAEWELRCEVSRATIEAIVTAAPIDAVRDFADGFWIAEDHDHCEVDDVSDSEARDFAVDILVAGQGDLDSGCPQTEAGLRALFTTDLRYLLIEGERETEINLADFLSPTESFAPGTVDAACALRPGQTLHYDGWSIRCEVAS